MKQTVKQKKRQRGFTLIELMAVVAILAVLATIAIPNVVAAVDRGRASTNQANREILRSAILRFQLATGHFPTTLDALLTNYINGIPTVFGAAVVTPAANYGWTPVWELIGGVWRITNINIPPNLPGS